MNIKNDPAVKQSLEMDLNDDAVNTLSEYNIRSATWLWEFDKATLEAWFSDPENLPRGSTITIEALDGDDTTWSNQAGAQTETAQSIVSSMNEYHEDTMNYSAHQTVTKVRARVSFTNSTPGDMDGASASVEVLETEGTLS